MRPWSQVQSYTLFLPPRGCYQLLNHIAPAQGEKTYYVKKEGCTGNILADAFLNIMMMVIVVAPETTNEEASLVI